VKRKVRNKEGIKKGGDKASCEVGTLKMGKEGKTCGGGWGKRGVSNRRNRGGNVWGTFYF